MSELEEARRKRFKIQDNTAIAALESRISCSNVIPQQTIRTTRKVIEDGKGKIVIKGAWSPDEDKVMLEACTKYGFVWKKVAACVEGRSAKQCRDRYRLKLDPSINHGPWTPEEDEKLLQLFDEMGRTWTKIAKKLPGRTENAVKSRYSSLFRAKTKEWSETEERLLQTLHSKGYSFKVIASEHLSHRSEHAVRKRWEKLLMKEIAQKIKQDIPALKQSSFPAPTTQFYDDHPKLNPKLAASTLALVKDSDELTAVNGLVTQANSTLSASRPDVQSLHSKDINQTSVGSVYNAPSTSLFPKLADIGNKDLMPLSTNTSGRRLKRYSTSTVVMVQMIGEPLNLTDLNLKLTKT